MKRAGRLGGVLALAVAPWALVAGLAGPAGATTVSTEAQLRAAFATDAEVVLANDITLSDCGSGAVARTAANAPVTVNGQGHTVTQTCGDRVFNVVDDSDVTFSAITITGGVTLGDGAGIEMDGNGDLTLVDSRITGNCADDDGGAIETDEDQLLTIVRSTIDGNSSADNGGAIFTDGGPLMVSNSTITGNMAVGQGGALWHAAQTATFVYDTVASNALGAVACGLDPTAVPTAPSVAAPEADADDGDIAPLQVDPANLYLNDNELSAFATVVALPSGGPNCDAVGSTTDGGYNYSDDDSCGFASPTSVQNGPDPLLGALGDNGGLTPTRLPQTGSPLIDAIPVASCNLTAVEGIDQRQVTRPQGSGCDIGAVEVEVEVVIVRFTG